MSFLKERDPVKTVLREFGLSPGFQVWAERVVSTLTAQLAELKRRHRDEINTLQQALEAAHGENLELRRRLGSQRTLHLTSPTP